MIDPEVRPKRYLGPMALVGLMGIISALFTFLFMIIVNRGIALVWEQAALTIGLDPRLFTLLICTVGGLLVGLLIKLVLVIYRSSRPYLSALGRVPGVPGAYTSLERHPENIPAPCVLILRLDSPMIYYNAVTVRDQVKAMVAAAQPRPQAVILDAAVQNQVDVTSAEVLRGMVKKMQGKGIAVHMADLHAPVVQFAQRVGIIGLVDEDRSFPTVDAAVHAAERLVAKE